MSSTTITEYRIAHRALSSAEDESGSESSEAEAEDSLINGSLVSHWNKATSTSIVSRAPGPTDPLIQ